MNIEIIERNYQVSEHLRRITTQKLLKLDKYFDGEGDCKIYFKKEKNSLKTEVMLNYRGNFIRATEISDNFYENIDKVLPKVEGQIRKYRTKFDKMQKNSAYKEQPLFESDPDEIVVTDKIVKEKNFKLLPMTVDQAIEEMNMLGHSFYVFFDVKSQSMKILYLRDDGNLGIIEPNV